ncbi:MAG: hypothetical protein KDD46_08120 [Bdellovibrionales bacterium]|nr:hypothetical protein [Bdellovibrionales bacterium]
MKNHTPTYTQATLAVRNFESTVMGHQDVLEQRIWIASRQALIGALSTSSLIQPWHEKMMNNLHFAKWSVVGQCFAFQSSKNISNIILHSVANITNHKKKILRDMSFQESQSDDFFHLWIPSPPQTPYPVLAPWHHQSRVINRSLLTYTNSIKSRLPNKLEKLAILFSQHIDTDFLSLEKIKAILLHQHASFRSYLQTLTSVFKKQNIEEKNFWISCYYNASSQALLQYLYENHHTQIHEIQHGMISENHAGYGLNEENFHKEIFPQSFYHWGKDWFSLFPTVTPFAHRKKILMGHPHYQSSIQCQPEPKSILICSQRSLGSDFDVFVEKFIQDKLKKNYRIFIKVHPSEEKSRTQFFKKLAQHSQVTWIKPSISTLEVLTKVKYHMSVYSTVLYEANSLGVINLIPNGVKRADISEPLVKAMGAAMVDPNTDLETLVPQKKAAFFEPYQGLFS